MLRENLTTLGYTLAQATVLETTVKLGESKAGNIIKTAELQSSVVYNALRQLEELGLISRTRKSSIDFYACPHPEQIVIIAEKKLFLARQTVRQLSAIACMSKVDTVAHVFTGWDGIESAYDYAHEHANSKETRYFAVQPEWLTARATLFFEHIDVKQKSRKQQSRGIAPQSQKKIFTSYTASTIRYTDSPIPQGITIIGKCLLTLNLTEKPRAVVIESEEITQIYREMWDKLWAESRK